MASEQQAYRTSGVCARAITFTIDDDRTVHDVQFTGGCNGNLKGIGQLIEGMPAQWVIERCRGTRCGGKASSCPDQLAQALQQALDGDAEALGQ